MLKTLYRFVLDPKLCLFVAAVFAGYGFYTDDQFYDKCCMTTAIIGALGQVFKDMPYQMYLLAKDALNNAPSYSSPQMFSQAALAVAYGFTFYETTAGCAGEGSLLSHALEQQGLQAGFRILCSAIAGVGLTSVTNLFQRMLNNSVKNTMATTLQQSRELKPRRWIETNPIRSILFYARKAGAYAGMPINPRQLGHDMIASQYKSPNAS